MKKLEDLIEKRESEIVLNKKTQKDDEKNHNEAIISGVFGALGGGLGGAVAGFVLAGIGVLIDSIFRKSGNAFWPWIVFFGCIIIGVVNGYNTDFKEKKQDRR